MGKWAKLDRRVVAFVIPAVLGVLAALATVSTDMLAYLEGPLPAVLLTTGLVVGLVAAAVVSIVSTGSEPEPSAARSGTTERLEMLSRLHAVITDRLGDIDEKLASVQAADSEVADVRREMDRLERFLFDVHGVSSLHDADPDLTEVDPSELVHAVIDRTAKVTGDRTVKADLPTEPDPINADRKLLSLALINLVVNAVKFSTPHTPIQVRIVDGPERVTFEVEDEGPGVPEDEDVWGELARGSNAAGIPGAGLGLPLVRLIAEAHGGSASLRSTGTGTVASIEVPRR